jgi:hypothetical protein
MRWPDALAIHEGDHREWIVPAGVVRYATWYVNSDGMRKPRVSTMAFIEPPARFAQRCRSHPGDVRVARGFEDCLMH